MEFYLICSKSISLIFFLSNNFFREIDLMEEKNLISISRIFFWINFQQRYDAAAKELDEKRKQEPPPKVGPISKQIAAKAKLRPGILILKFIY